jgi:demethylmenaquinone methyltransferase/2-methoxy-6-polyprenyl-1,4-benzoquinol methylase
VCGSAGHSNSSLARSIFGGLSSSYDLVVDLMTLRQDRNWKHRMLERLGGPRRGATMLDVGCGTGILEEMAMVRDSGMVVVGVDITRAMVRIAQRKGGWTAAPLLGLADAERLPFRDCSFDYVVSCYVPKYCDTRRFVQEVGRVLKPGGRMAVYDFARPRGVFAPFLDYYIYGLLPVMGKVVAPMDPELAFTCSVLPGLIRSTRWREEMDAAIRGSEDLSKEGEEQMTGGTVTLFWASKGLTDRETARLPADPAG